MRGTFDSGPADGVTSSAVADRLKRLANSTQALLRQPSERTIISFGDSTTAPRPNVVTYSDLLQEHFARHKMSVRVVNAGVPGNTTAHAALRFQKDVLNHAPQLVIMQFGVNDAAVDVWRKPPAKRTRVSILMYQKNLRFFVRKLSNVDSDVIVMTPNPLCWTEFMRYRYGRSPYNPADDEGCNVVLKEYASAVRRLAAEEGVGLVDVYTAFKEYSRTPGQATEDLLLDGMHPNNAGHALVARLLLSQLEERRWVFN